MSLDREFLINGVPSCFTPVTALLLRQYFHGLVIAVVTHANISYFLIKNKKSPQISPNLLKIGFNLYFLLKVS